MSNAEYAMLFIFCSRDKKKISEVFLFFKKKKRSNAHFIYFVCHVFMIIPVLRHNLCIPSNGLFDGQRAETDRHRAEIKLHAPQKKLHAADGLTFCVAFRPGKTLQSQPFSL